MQMCFPGYIVGSCECRHKDQTSAIAWWMVAYLVCNLESVRPEVRSYCKWFNLICRFINSSSATPFFWKFAFLLSFSIARLVCSSELYGLTCSISCLLSILIISYLAAVFCFVIIIVGSCAGHGDEIDVFLVAWRATNDSKVSIWVQC